MRVAIATTLLPLFLMAGTANATSDASPTSQPTVKDAGVPEAPECKDDKVKNENGKCVKKGPEDVEGAVSMFKQMVTAFKTGNYREAGALVVLLLMFVWRRFVSQFLIGKMSKWQLALTTVMLGFLVTIPSALLAEKFSWWTFVYSACISSAEAMAMWLVIVKKLPWFKIPEDKKAETTIPVVNTEPVNKP